MPVPSTREGRGFGGNGYRMFYVYIIESELDSSYYIGYTSDLQRRIEGHNRGQTRWTRMRRPWKLVYCEEYKEKKDALKREKFLKRQKNREFYRKLILKWNHPM